MNFRLFQTERFCRRHSFKFDENSRNFSKKIENTVEKGEIKLLITINFSFSHSEIKRPVLQTHKNQSLFGKVLTLHSTDTHFDALRTDSF